MRLKKHTIAFVMMSITSLWGCAPTEEEKRQAEEEEKNKPSLSIQPVGTLVEPDETSLLTSATVIMSKTVDDNVTFKYSLNGVTASPGSDFEAKSGTLTIPSGSNSASIDLTILADEFDEQDEEFMITLSAPVNAKLGIAADTVVIQDSALDVKPIIAIEPIDPVQEPDNGSTTVSAVVKLSSFSAFPVTVDYSLDSVSADSGLDFEASSGTLDFPPGTNSVEIDLIIKADDIDEFDESFIVTLSSPVNATISNGVESVTIEDSATDVTTASFMSEGAIVAEGLSGYKVKVALSHISDKGINIQFSTSGVAVKDLDYKIEGENLIPVYGNFAEITIDFIDDSIAEGGESLILQLEATDNVELGDKTKFTFTIPGELGLNDTGVISWYDGSSLSGVPQDENSNYPGQDADFGYDVDSSPNGFSFTALDIDGDSTEPGPNARCVQDNRTGLVFEIKKDQEILPQLSDKDLEEELKDDRNPYPSQHANWQANNYTYSWYTTDSTNDGGDPGVKGDEFVNADYPISRECAFPSGSSGLNGCNTLVYAEAINASRLCGFTDWKLPTIEQLRSIHNYQGTSPSNINVDYFPYMNNGKYLSSTSSSGNKGSALCISGSTGQVSLCNKGLLNYVRMVRGGVE